MSDEDWTQVKSKKKGKSFSYRILPEELALEARRNPKKKEQLDLCRRYKKGFCDNKICSFPHTERERSYWKFVMAELYECPWKNESDIEPPHGNQAPQRLPPGFPDLTKQRHPSHYLSSRSVVPSQKKTEDEENLPSFVLHHFVAQRGGSISPQELQVPWVPNSNDCLLQFVSEYGGVDGLVVEDNRIVSSCFSGVNKKVREGGGAVLFDELEKYFKEFAIGKYVTEVGGVAEFFRLFGKPYGLFVNEEKETIEKLGRKKKEKLEPQKEERVESGGGGNVCFMCGVNQRVIVFIPCGHLASCEECGEKTRRADGGATCPICWSSSEFPGKIKVCF